MKRRLLFISVVTIIAMIILTPCLILAKEVKITVATHITPQYKDMFPPIVNFVDTINAYGKGKVKAELYHSGTLYKMRDLIPALLNGSCEIIFNTTTHTTGSWPEMGGISLPFLYQDEIDTRDRWMIDGKLFELVNQEMIKKHGVRVLAPGILPGILLGTKGKPVKSASDLKGMKIRGTGKPDSAILQNCGASPTFMSSAEVYEALHRGIVDGVASYPGMFVARNLQEMLDYLILMKPRLVSWAFQIYVLNKTFNSWPKDVQNIINMAATNYDYYYTNNMLKYSETVVIPSLLKRLKIIKPTEKAMAEFEKLGKDTYPNWVKTVDPKFAKKFIELSKQPLVR